MECQFVSWTVSEEESKSIIVKEKQKEIIRTTEEINEFKMVPIWLFDIFPYNVWEYGISDIFSWCRSISSLREAIKLFWTFRVPWGWTYTAGTVADWVAQFSFGFYSLMLTSLLLGLIVMVLYKPRTWCAFCPMGTMTQGICKLKNNEKK